MKAIRLLLSLVILALGLATAPPAGAFVLHTSARVEIVPGVEILRVGADLPEPGAVEAGSVGFFVDGPDDRAVRVAWTVQPAGDDAPPASTSASRHDESGGLLLEYDYGEVEADAPLDGYRLTLEYE